MFTSLRKSVRARPTIPPPLPPKPHAAESSDEKDQKIQQLLNNLRTMTVKNNGLIAENNKLKESNLVQSDEIKSLHATVTEKSKIISSLQKKVKPAKMTVSKLQQTTPTRPSTPVPRPRTTLPQPSNTQPTPELHRRRSEISQNKPHTVIAPRRLKKLSSSARTPSPVREVENLDPDSLPTIIPLMNVLFPPDDLWDIILWLSGNYG